VKSSDNRYEKKSEFVERSNTVVDKLKKGPY